MNNQLQLLKDNVQRKNRVLYPIKEDDLAFESKGVYRYVFVKANKSMKVLPIGNSKKKGNFFKSV